MVNTGGTEEVYQPPDTMDSKSTLINRVQVLTETRIQKIKRATSEIKFFNFGANPLIPILHVVASSWLM